MEKDIGRIILGLRTSTLLRPADCSGTSFASARDINSETKRYTRGEPMTRTLRQSYTSDIP